MLALEVLQLPLGCEQQDETLLAIDSPGGAAAGGRHRGAVGVGNPPRRGNRAAGSTSTETPYSVFSRPTMTSNCSAPTTPASGSRRPLVR